MTEQEWLECADPTPMLEFLDTNVGERKARLFAICRCRQLVRFLSDETIKTLELSEMVADGLSAGREFNSPGASKYSPRAFVQLLADVAVQTKRKKGKTVVASIMSWLKVSWNYSALSEEQELTGYCDYLRDMVGNPFRPVTIKPAWLNSTVDSLATAIYADRAFDRLPILADALEDAGCDHADILNHCRQPGEHVRGCWAVDLLLDRK
jgi:hypothetical protein